jgi:hypothetical protein
MSLPQTRGFLFRGLLLSLGFSLTVGPAAEAQAGPAEGGVVSGRVISSAGTPVSSASVTLLSPEASAVRVGITSPEGRFRIAGVEAGQYTARFVHLGHATAEVPVVVSARAPVWMEVELEIAAVAIEGVEVRAIRDLQRERARFETEAGVTARVIGGDDLRMLPGLAEADVMRAVEMLPGVVSTNDFSSAYNVRGGSADQNLILLDGFPIFNPFHLGGLFSVFNSSVVDRAELLSGGFGAEYGGRVSSVLNVESTTPSDTARLSGAGGVSLLSSRIALQAGLPEVLGTALGGTGGSWFVAARRSYFDVLLRPVFDFPYHLTDGQLQLSLGTRGGGRLRVTGYAGNDVLNLRDLGGSDDEERSFLRLDWRWGNDVAGLHWTQPVGAGWIVDTRVGLSRYRDGLSFLDFEDTRFSSRITQLFARSDLRRDFARGSLRSGGDLFQLRYRNQAEAGGTEFLGSADDGVGGAAYVAGQWRPDREWIIDGGLRLEGWRPAGTQVTTASPRFAVKRFVGAERVTAVKLAAGRYTQFLQSLRNEEFPLSNDIWIAAGEHVPHVVSDQLQGGLESFIGEDWFVSAEAYARTFQGVIEVNPADDPNDPADDLLAGRGLSRGMDFHVRRHRGRVSGWASVSLLWAERTFPDPTGAASVGGTAELTFPPHWDRRINANLVLLAELPRRTTASMRWTFGSALPYTRPVSQHLDWEYDVGSGRYRVPPNPFREGSPPLYVVLGERNAERYPHYHRLDLTVRRRFEPRWGVITPYAQVLNAYNRRNVLFYFYNFEQTPPTRSGLSMFPVLPTIGVEVAF